MGRYARDLEIRLARGRQTPRRDIPSQLPQLTETPSRRRLDLIPITPRRVGFFIVATSLAVTAVLARRNDIERAFSGRTNASPLSEPETREPEIEKPVPLPKILLAIASAVDQTITAQDCGPAQGTSSTESTVSAAVPCLPYTAGPSISPYDLDTERPACGPNWVMEKLRSFLPEGDLSGFQITEGRERNVYIIARTSIDLKKFPWAAIGILVDLESQKFTLTDVWKGKVTKTVKEINPPQSPADPTLATYLSKQEAYGAKNADPELGEAIRGEKAHILSRGDTLTEDFRLENDGTVRCTLTWRRPGADSAVPIYGTWGTMVISRSPGNPLGVQYNIH